MTQQDPWILPPKLVMLPSGYLLRLTFILWPHPSLLASSRVIHPASVRQGHSPNCLRNSLRNINLNASRLAQYRKNNDNHLSFSLKIKRSFSVCYHSLLPSHCFISVQALALRSSTRTASLVWPLFLVPKSRVRAREHVGPNSFTDGDPLKATTMSPYSFLLLVIKNSTFFQFSA
jgi:hypothetical protein